MRHPELKLLIAACRAAYGGRPVHLDDSSAIRWDRLAKLGERHRVQALCWHGLGDVQRQVPDRYAEPFAQAARDIVGQAMRMASECARLNRSFAQAGIDLLFVKGVTLGALAYPNPFLKMGMDIDLLVAAERLQDATATLRESGYRTLIPSQANSGLIERWHTTHKESVWRHSVEGFQLDLHSRLAEQPAMIPAIGMNSPRQSVTVAPTIQLPTLAADELFAYLCVHGASSAWSRLKWVCDLAALLHSESSEEIERLHERSQQLGAGRAATQALLVADSVFGINLSDKFRERLGSDPISRWLANIAMRQLEAEWEPLDRTLGTLSIHASQLFMLPGLASISSELFRQLRSVAQRKP